MIRGTTPTHTFILPFPASTITEAYISYAQFGSVRIEKTLADCTVRGSNLTLKLSQAETLRLSDKARTEIQLAVRIDEEVYRSQIIEVETARILKEAEI